MAALTVTSKTLRSTPDLVVEYSFTSTADGDTATCTHPTDVSAEEPNEVTIWTPTLPTMTEPVNEQVAAVGSGAKIITIRNADPVTVAYKVIFKWYVAGDQDSSSITV